jgi:membrane fusion protein, heavy metal efflux system
MISVLLRHRIPAATFGLLAMMLAGCGDEHHGTEHHGTEHPGTDHHAHDHAGAADAHKGPHGGRLLVDGDFALEISIFERGTPPEFRLYASREGAAVAPSDVQAVIELSRINGVAGGHTDRHVFAARDDHLVSTAEVYEPHSFSVTVTASHAGRSYRWRYASPEAQTRIDADIAAAQGIRTGTAAGGVITERLPLYGTITPDPQRQRRVAGRYPGLARSVTAQLGDIVAAGQTLATIESNESLQVYAVTAPIAGVVTRRAINAGELAAAGDHLFEIADFSSVWAQFDVFPRDLSRIRRGQTVRLQSVDDVAGATAAIDYLAPAGGTDQTVVARVVVDNRQGEWIPGQFVTAAVTVDASPAALVVPLSAVQNLRDWDVVFAVQDDVYQALPVQLGRRDADHVEILAGLEAGARIVVDNSYLVKADIEKSGAAHDH